ncbi:hypothetical protein BD410DRAFT_806479 [Rickenella mellea]|uniref:Uncharacterized protein n=1 Tax=Rickenella mellea TaxID=50990 RepID=A0A4Y7PTQ2_9AGAM|nr:hypothetical protein BD410DRAFT_806479 [Rickenella mellea]
MIFILPALTFLPVVALCLSIVSSSVGSGGPFSIGSLTTWSSWIDLQISLPSLQSHRPVASPSVTFIASPNQVETSLPPAALAESTSTSPTIPLANSVSPHHNDDGMVFLQTSKFHEQLPLASELPVKTMEANFGNLGSPPPPLSPRPAAQPVIDSPPTHPPSPAASLPITPTSLTDVRRSTSPKHKVCPSSREVKPSTSTRMTRSEHMQLKGCFFDDTRACPRTNTVDGFMDFFVELGTIVLVFVVVMACAIVISAFATTQYLSESIGVPPITPHNMAVIPGCSASQQASDTSSPQQDHVSIPPWHHVAVSAIDVQTDDPPFPGAFREAEVFHQVHSPSVSDVSPVVLDASPPYTKEALDFLSPQSSNVNLEMDKDLPVCPPAIQIDDADSPLDCSVDDLSVALYNLIGGFRRLKKDIGELTITPPPASPLSTAPASPVLPIPPSLPIPHWTENQIEYQRIYNLGQDGFPPSLSERSFKEGLQDPLKSGDHDGVQGLTSIPPESRSFLCHWFGEDELSRFVFEFTLKMDINQEDHEVEISTGSSADSSSFSFVYPLAKRCKREHEDEDDASSSWASFACSGSELEDFEISMEMTSILDDVLKHPSSPTPESTSLDVETVPIPEIQIIIDSSQSTSSKSSAAYPDLSGMDDNVPMSSTPMKSGTPLDTFHMLCLASIRSTGNTSGVLDGLPALSGTPDFGCSTSSLDLSRHLPPLSASDFSLSSHAPPALDISASEQASYGSSFGPDIAPPGHHHLGVSTSSGESDYHSGHLPPAWFFNMDAYRHPPPMSTNNSFFIGSSQSLSLSSTSVHHYTRPVSESIPDPADLVTVEDHGAAPEDLSLEPEAPLCMDDMALMDGEYSLDQTIGVELAGCNDVGLELLDEHEESQPWSPGTVFDGAAKLCSLVPSSSQVALDIALIQELGAEGIDFSGDDISYLMGRTFAAELEGLDSACPEILEASSLDVVPPPNQTHEESDPSSCASFLAPVPRIGDLFLSPWTTERGSGESSEYSLPAEEDNLQEVVPCSQTIASTSTQWFTSSETNTGTAKSVGGRLGQDVFVRESTPDLTFDTSSVASPVSALSTLPSRAYFRSFDIVQKAISPSHIGTARSPLRECFGASYSSSSPPPSAGSPTSRRELDMIPVRVA